MRVTGTLYVTDHRARIRMRKGTIVVEQADGWRRVPIESLDGLVLTGRAEITNDAIGELVRRGIRIAALSKTGRLRFAIGGPVSGNVHLRIAQLEKATSTDESNELARCLVAGKLQNCRRVARRWMGDAGVIERTVMEVEIAQIGSLIEGLKSAPSADHIRGIEGDGSRRYFKCMGIHLGSADPPIRFEQRNRRPPRDPVNAVLSFVYGLVLTELVGALDAVGLDPQIGYLHRPRSGRQSLALDLLEEFRPSVADRFSVALLARHQLTENHFQKAGGACYLSEPGRTALLELWEDYRNRETEHKLLGRSVGLWSLLSTQATLLARHIRGDLPVYPPYLIQPSGHTRDLRCRDPHEGG